MRIQKTTRLKAGLLHFAISFSIFLGIFLISINFWYPSPYFEASGGWQGIQIVASVDVILGPLLTLIIFSPKKSVRELAVDIGTIAMMQVIALCWGVYVLHDQRPVAVVFWEDSFMTIPAQALKEQLYDVEKLTALSGEKPPLIYAQKPTKLDDLKNLLALMNKSQLPPPYHPQLYRPIKDYFPEIKPLQIDIDKVINKHPHMIDQLQAIQQKNKVKRHDLSYFILKSKYSDSVLVFDHQANYLGYINPY